MSRLRNGDGDEDLHYSNNSHRWIAPPGVEQALWEKALRVHLEAHQAELGDEAAPAKPPPPPQRLHLEPRASGTRRT